MKQVIHAWAVVKDRRFSMELYEGGVTIPALVQEKVGAEKLAEWVDGKPVRVTVTVETK